MIFGTRNGKCGRSWRKFQRIARRDWMARSDCIFCSIATKTSFARVVFETDDVICFFPLEPEMLGHTLIVSKQHYHHVGDVPPEFGRSVFAASQALSNHYKKALGTAEFNLMSANGEKAEQSVQHLHFQLK